jgi:hypothetical protein
MRKDGGWKHPPLINMKNLYRCAKCNKILNEYEISKGEHVKHTTYIDFSGFIVSDVFKNPIWIIKKLLKKL